MSEGSYRDKLTPIPCADVAGYSRPTSRDETGVFRVAVNMTLNLEKNQF